MTSLHISTDMNMKNFTNTPSEYHFEGGDFLEDIKVIFSKDKKKLGKIMEAGTDVRKLDSLVGSDEMKVPRPLTKLAAEYIEGTIATYGSYFDAPPEKIVFHFTNFEPVIGCFQRTIQEIIGLMIKNPEIIGLEDYDETPMNEFFAEKLAEMIPDVPDDGSDVYADEDGEEYNIQEEYEINDGEPVFDEDEYLKQEEDREREELLSSIALPTKEITLIVSSEKYIQLVNQKPVVAKTVPVKSERGVSAYRSVDQSKIVLSDQITRFVYFIMKPGSRSSAVPYRRTFSENAPAN